MGNGYRKNSTNTVEIVLEPNVIPIAKDYQEGLYAAGIPVTMFGVDNLDGEHQALNYHMYHQK
jgi:hypothetical protein